MMKHILLSIAIFLSTFASIHAQTQGSGVTDIDSNAYKMTNFDSHGSLSEGSQFILEKNEFFNGSGTPEDPYRIETIQQLQSIYPDYLDKHFIQTRDIDASATEHWNDGEGFYPIGDNIIGFSGQFDGNGHSISNLFIDRKQDIIGLFGFVENGMIKNVNLIDVNISGHSGTGAIAGRFRSSRLSSSSASGTVSGISRVGGLIGDSITNSLAGIFEGSASEYLRKRGIEEARTPVSASMGKMSGSLIGAGITLTLAWTVTGMALP